MEIRMDTGTENRPGMLLTEFGSTSEERQLNRDAKALDLSPGSTFPSTSRALSRLSPERTPPFLRRSRGTLTDETSTTRPLFLFTSRCQLRTPYHGNSNHCNIGRPCIRPNEVALKFSTHNGL